MALILIISLLIILLITIFHSYYYSLIFTYDNVISYSTINFKKLLNCNDQLNKINLYFINLTKSIERKNRFVKRMCKFSNYNLHRVNAISPENLKNYNFKLPWYCHTMTENEKSCLLSHLYTIYLSYKRNDKYSIICEDDAVIERNINWEYLISKLPKDWDIIQLYYFDLPFINQRTYKQVKKNGFLYKTNNVMFSACAYLINQKGMKRIITNYIDNKNIDLYKTDKYCLADYTIYNNLNRYILNYPMIYPEELDTTISNFNLTWRNLFLH